MLLRRVMRHVSDQNWLAVFIDFLIVVVGIFVGLQVQSWSINRAELKQERVYLERILADVERSIAVNEFIVDFNSKHIDDIWVVYQSLKSCQLNDDQKDQFANGLYNIGRFVRSSYLMGAAKEMQSAGQFGLIRSVKVRNIINELADGFEYEQVLFPSINSRLGPSMAYMDQQFAVSIYETDLVQDIVWSDIEIDFETLCKDSRFLGALSMTRSVRDVHIRRNMMALELFREGEEALREELSKSSK